MAITNIDPDEAIKLTIESYNHHIGEYVKKDHGDDANRTVAYWPGVELFLDQLDRGQEIFEIGSRTGSDAQRIESQGFIVLRSDATKAFLELMRNQGHKAEYYDVLKGPTQNKHSAIFANAVFLHFDVNQFHVALKNTHASLTKNGLFSIGMKVGDFEGWREKGLSGKRYFKLWKIQDLKNALAKENFKLLNVYVTPNKDFVFITAQAQTNFS
jgi:hypothetical protein